MSEYEVIVGNVGSVYRGARRRAAEAKYAAYVELSQRGSGRAGGEPVTLMQDGEPIEEHTPAAAGEALPAAALVKALQALVLDVKIRAYLRANDPKALQQAASALSAAGAQYLVRDVPTDLCWYCLAPLVCTFKGGDAYCSACGTVEAPAAGETQAE